MEVTTLIWRWTELNEGEFNSLPHLKYTNIQGLNNEESVIVSPVFSVHTLKKGEIKRVSVLKRLPSALAPGPLP